MDFFSIMSSRISGSWANTSLYFATNAFISPHYFKHIACLYQKHEFFLQHDLTIFSVTFCSFFFLIVIWKFNCSKSSSGYCITDISLIRPIRNRLFYDRRLFRHCFQIFGIGFTTLSVVCVVPLYKTISGVCTNT